MAISRFGHWNPGNELPRIFNKYDPDMSQERIKTPRSVNKILSLDRTRNENPWIYNSTHLKSFNPKDIKVDKDKGKVLKKLKKKQRLEK